MGGADDSHSNQLQDDRYAGYQPSRPCVRVLRTGIRMRNSRFRLIFAICSTGWLILSLYLAPHMSGEDVYIFRDAGWNLAAHGSFQSAALVYMTDLTPRLNAHYTPLMPLLFAGYAAIFPRNAYAGTVFNLLLGLLAAAVALECVLRLRAGAMRNAAAAAVAAIPVVFITYDRPEALALALFALTAAYSTRPAARPALAGLLIALAFLAHPFAAVAAAVWVSALFLLRNWNRPGRWLRTFYEVAVAAASCLVPLVLVAFLYYSLDHDSLARFAEHTLGRASGVHAAGSGGWLHAIHKAIFGLSALAAFTYLASLASTFLLAAWALARRRDLGPPGWLPVLAGVGCTLISVFLFSIQANYILLLAFLIPVGLLIVGRAESRLAHPALALLLLAILVRLPGLGLELLERAQQLPSYRAAKSQPAYLRAQLSAPDAVVAVEGDSYDLFKPEFARMIRLDYVQDKDQYRSVAAVANCYDALHAPANAVRPLPDRLSPSDFAMIQPDPQHTWIGLFGHRLMAAQWGYGCDLYVRRPAIGANSAQIE
jgi:hypothetical protein